MKRLWIAAFVLALGAWSSALPIAASGTGPSMPTIASNDNRVPAGHVVGHELHLSIDAVWGRWYPDGRRGESAPIQAFEQVGRAPQNPGPVIRVVRGTLVVLSVRNSIRGTRLTMHGLMDRPALRDRSFLVPFGQTRVVRFRAGAVGTYLYWGSTTGQAINARFGDDSQLNGALVVDPPNVASLASHDRILVIAQWINVRGAHGQPNFAYELDTINGLAWPHTERLSYAVGQTVRWRLIDGSFSGHPMHLHGFFFTIDSRGDGTADTIYRPADRDRRVTELIEPGHTLTMSWKAARAGHWLFHCHIPYHTMAHLPIADMVKRSFKPSDAMPGAAMGGLIVGISVHGPTQTISERSIAQRIQLVVEQRRDSTKDTPSFRYVLKKNGTTVSEPGAIGPPIVLTHGVPVAIDVLNELSEPTSVHWHGMELQDSYYDGVAGFSGEGKHRASLIAPGKTFEARMIPPRAGTFIYHTHRDDVYQLRGGLAGPLIVLEPGQRFDPTTDHIYMLTIPSASADILKILVNGTFAPPPLVVRAGVRQRLRFINLTTFWTNAMISISSGGRTIAWQPLAVDGAELPLARRTLQSAVDTVTIGQTRDYTFTPKRGNLLLQIWPDPTQPPVNIPVQSL
jgi:FtsP/CotA-like multicopper oxidase with cupredoxin domain